MDGEKARELPPAVSFLLNGSKDPKMTEPIDRVDEVPLKEDHPDWCIKISVELKDPHKGLNFSPLLAIC